MQHTDEAYNLARDAVMEGRKTNSLATIIDYQVYQSRQTKVTGYELELEALNLRNDDVCRYIKKVKNFETAMTTLTETANIPTDLLKTVIDEAKDIITTRGKDDYGSAERCMGNIAAQWNLYLSQKYGKESSLKEEDVCQLMVLLKMVRDMHKPKRDNIVDQIGYTALIQEIRESKDE